MSLHFTSPLLVAVAFGSLQGKTFQQILSLACLIPLHSRPVQEAPKGTPKLPGDSYAPVDWVSVWPALLSEFLIFRIHGKAIFAPWLEVLNVSSVTGSLGKPGVVDLHKMRAE